QAARRALGDPLGELQAVAAGQAGQQAGVQRADQPANLGAVDLAEGAASDGDLAALVAAQVDVEQPVHHAGGGHGVLCGAQAQAGPEGGARGAGAALQPVLEGGQVAAVPQGGLGLISG